MKNERQTLRDFYMDTIIKHPSDTGFLKKLGDILVDYEKSLNEASVKARSVSKNEQAKLCCPECESTTIYGNGVDTNICDDCGYEWQYC